MPRKDLEDYYFRQLEKGKSVQEAFDESGKEGWGEWDMWSEWAIDAAVKRYHKKYGKSDETRRAEFFYYSIIIIAAVLLMAFFSAPR